SPRWTPGRPWCCARPTSPRCDGCPAPAPPGRAASSCCAPPPATRCGSPPTTRLPGPGGWTPPGRWRQPDERRTRPDERRTRPDERRTRPDERRTRPDGHEGRRPGARAGQGRTDMPLTVDENSLKQGVLSLVVTLVEVIQEALDRQALRRMNGGDLTPEESERLADALLELDEALEQIKEDHGIVSSVADLHRGL